MSVTVNVSHLGLYFNLQLPSGKFHKLLKKICLEVAFRGGEQELALCTGWLRRGTLWEQEEDTKRGVPWSEP